jgi:hypothetical protein
LDEIDTAKFYGRHDGISVKGKHMTVAGAREMGQRERVGEPLLLFFAH